MMYAPVSFVTVVRVSPVSVWRTVTVTPGRASPPLSFTFPLIWAVETACAQAVAAESSTTMQVRQIRVAADERIRPPGRGGMGKVRGVYHFASKIVKDSLTIAASDR